MRSISSASACATRGAVKSRWRSARTCCGSIAPAHPVKPGPDFALSRSPATRRSSCATGSTPPAASTSNAAQASTRAGPCSAATRHSHKSVFGVSACEIPAGRARSGSALAFGMNVRIALVQHPLGAVQRKTLSIVDTEFAQRLRAGIAGDPFGHDVQATLVSDFGDRVDDRTAHRIGVEIANETAVDLDHVDREVFQIAE